MAMDDISRFQIKVEMKLERDLEQIDRKIKLLAVEIDKRGFSNTSSGNIIDFIKEIESMKAMIAS